MEIQPYLRSQERESFVYDIMMIIPVWKVKEIVLEEENVISNDISMIK